ncbi:hypothetical protein DRN75_04205 [Nanoarchaeota archaeon]|nr:MAG: hypothetical protein DRN75_04205 [Nanoarchaeota archaeon]
MDKKMIDRVRQYYQLPAEVADEQISKKLGSSFGKAMASLDIAKGNLVDAFKEVKIIFDILEELREGGAER